MLNFIPLAINGIAGYFKDRQKINAAKSIRKDELKSKKLDTQLEGIKNAQESDIIMDNNSRKISGWMDDVSFFVFLIPAVLAFHPDAVPHITAGFVALESMPVWYQYALGLMLAAVWGYRRLVAPLAEIVVKHFAKKMGV